MGQWGGRKAMVILEGVGERLSVCVAAEPWLPKSSCICSGHCQLHGNNKMMTMQVLRWTWAEARDKPFSWITSFNTLISLVDPVLFLSPFTCSGNRCSRVESCAQGHTTSQWWSQALNLCFQCDLGQAISDPWALVSSFARNKGAAQDDLQDPFKPTNTGLPLPMILPGTTSTGQAHIPVAETLGECLGSRHIAGLVGPPTCAHTRAHTHTLTPCCPSRGQHLLLVTAETWPVGSVPIDRNTAGLRGHRLQSKPDGHGFSRTEEMLSPLAPSLPGSASKRRRKATLQPGQQAARQPGAHIPQSAHSPCIPPRAPLRSPHRVPQKGSRARADRGSPALSPVSPQGDFKGSTLWEMLGKLQKRNGVRASRKISCLTFSPAAYSSQDMRCMYSGKLTLTLELTFWAAINTPGGRVSAARGKGLGHRLTPWQSPLVEVSVTLCLSFPQGKSKAQCNLGPPVTVGVARRL